MGGVVVGWQGGHCQVRLDKAAAGVGGLRCLIRNKREGWSNELKTMLITGGEQKAAESFLFISFFFLSYDSVQPTLNALMMLRRRYLPDLGSAAARGGGFAGHGEQLRTSG